MNTRWWKAVAVVAAGLVFTAASCTDTTVEPKSSITGANVFNDPNSYTAFIARVYAGLAVTGQQGNGGAGNPDIQGIDEGFSQYLRLLWEHEELPTDEAAIAWGGDVGLDELIKGTTSSANAFVNGMYYRIFFQVGMANEFLRQTTDAALSSRGVSASMKATIQTYRAEARFLRALSYWHAIDIFGSVPLVTEDDALGSTPPKQASRDSLYNYVVSELQAIKSQLPDRGPAAYGRATKAAASMLLAKVYMNAQVYTGTAHWSEAMTALQDVLNAGYTLDPNYMRIFSADNNLSPEIIFGVPQDGQRTKTWGGTTFLVHAACGGNMSDAAYGISGCWWGIHLKQQAYNNFTAGDQRASYMYTNGQTVNMTDIYNFQTGIAAPKYTNKTSTGATGSDLTFVDTDYPIFRLGDAYLMYAELFLRGGGGTQAQALTYVNALRTRAGVTPWTATDLTLDNILAERGRELLFEGHRRTDLIRFGKFTGGSYLWAWKGGAQNGTSTPDFRALYPLPQNELVANPNLTQNPGY